MGGGSWDHQDEFGNNGHPVGGSWGDPHLGHQGAAPPPPPYEDFASCVVDQGGGGSMVNTAEPTTTAAGQYGMSKMEHLPLIAQVHEVSLSQLIRQLVLSVLILKYVLISAT